MSWVHAVIDVPHPLHDGAAAFWGGALGWPAGAPWPGHPELQSFEPPRGAPYVHLQRIQGAPRVHLDLESATPDQTVALASRLGATYVGRRDRWRTLLSPGGLPFCVLQSARRETPEAVTWPGGHRSRMVQVCIDAPGSVHDQEVSFWRAVLPGRWVDSGAAEFAGKWHDDAGSPLQLLFQRLDEPEGPVRAHLDHGSDDVSAEVRRLRALGAHDVGAGRGWHTLRDPVGLDFCVTDNSPARDVQRELG